MELKCNLCLAVLAKSLSSNRTFMELKFDGSDFEEAAHKRSNRTFMELKFDCLGNSHEAITF